MLIVQYISLFVAGIAIVMAVFFYLRLEQKHQQLILRLQKLESRHGSIEKGHNQLQEMLHEIRTGVLGLGNRVKELEAQLNEIKHQQNELSSKQVEIEHHEASTPLYTRAAKLVASGATIEEIMEECDLPRAEAELLVTMHRN